MDNWGQTVEEKQFKRLYHEIYFQLVQEIDANDNGISISEEKAYNSQSYLPIRVTRQNKPWND